MTTPGFSRKTGAELQALRKAAAEKCTAIAMQYVPEGYTVEYHKGRAKHYGKRKLIQVPRPITRRALWVFLHECGHAHLGHGHRKIPRHVKEAEACEWADMKMRQHNIPVPRATKQRAKQYVGWKIEQAIARRAKHIDPNARRYAK